MIDRPRDRGIASINRPAVKGVVGHGTPNPNADQAQCVAKRTLIQRLGGRRDQSSSALVTTAATHNATRAGHNAPL